MDEGYDPKIYDPETHSLTREYVLDLLEESSKDRRDSYPIIESLIEEGPYTVEDIESMSSAIYHSFERVRPSWDAISGGRKTQLRFVERLGWAALAKHDKETAVNAAAWIREYRLSPAAKLASFALRRTAKRSEEFLNEQDQE